MKEKLICALLTVGTAAGVGYAQDRDRDRDQPAKLGADDRKDNDRRDRDKDRPDRDDRNDRNDKDRASQKGDDGDKLGGGRGKRPRRDPDRKATGSPAMDKALNRMYRRGEFKPGKPSTINGVQVYDVSVQTDDGETIARITENGDFLVSGAPAEKSDLPPGVRETTQGLFRSSADADALIATYYFVYLDSGKNLYQLQVDAAGRLLDITTQEQLEQQMEVERRPADPSVEQDLEGAVKDEFPDAEVGDMYEWEKAEGFHYVKFTLDGKPGFVIIDPNGNIFSRRTNLQVKDLPEPVTKSVGQMFNVDRIRGAQKSEQTFYQFEQSVGDENLTVRLHPSGDVMRVQTDQPVRQEERNVVEKQRAKKRNRGGNDGRDARNDRDDRNARNNRDGGRVVP